MPTFDPSIALNLAGVAVAVVAAAIWLKSALVKQRHEELEQLAETRGNRIEDLKEEVDKLRTEVANLSGQIQAIQGLKTTEIITGVVTGLKAAGFTSE
jgi:TolA-binding protein